MDDRNSADRLPAAGAADVGTAARAADLERPDKRAAAAPDETAAVAAEPTDIIQDDVKKHDIKKDPRA